MRKFKNDDISEVITFKLPKSVSNLQLPDPEVVDYWRLEEDRILYLDREIDECTLSIQKNILYYNYVDKDVPVDERKSIVIMIDSIGGQLTEAMSIAATIRLSKTPVYTVNAGEADSGAALILASGDTRFALPYSTALIHSGSGELIGTAEQVESQQKIYKKQVVQMREYMEICGVDKTALNRNKNKEWYMTAEDQIKYGVVDKILENFDEIL